MTITIQSQVPIIILETIVILILLMIVNKKLKAYDPLSKPTGIIFVCIFVVEAIDGFVRDIVSPKKVEKLGPYIGSIAIYILLSNYIGLLGLDNPTGNYSVTLSLALISWIMFQYTDIKYSGLKSYVSGFFQPIFLFVIPNFFGTIAPLISMSLRLFGNILAGSIIMSLVYTFCNFLSTSVISLFTTKFSFNFVGPILAPVLHLYFDVWSGFIQMFIFIMLTMVFIGNRIPEDQK